MTRELDDLLSRMRNEQVPSFLLIHGDDFQIREAINAILNCLVPAEKRTFNLERFDGRSAPWEQIEAALLTPPFFPGIKAVFVDNAPYFLSREHKGDLGEKVLQLWRDGKRDEAARLLLDLLALEGWTEEAWERLDEKRASAEVAGLVGVNSADLRREVEGLVTLCRSRGPQLSRERGGDRQELSGLLERGVPPQTVLLVAASHIDRRTRLYRKFTEKGVALDLGLKREKTGRVSREVLSEFLERRLKEQGKRIEAQAREMILLRAGSELWSIHQELEKLFLYVGDEPWIKGRDVAQVFSDQGEAWIFDLIHAIGARNALAALDQLAHLLFQGEHPLRILGMIASEMRKLLAARQLIDGDLRRKWKRNMGFPEFKAMVLPGGSALLSQNAYGDYMVFQRAQSFSSRELFDIQERIYETDLHLKSTSASPRIVMERLILAMCQPSRAIQNEN
ncbi:MAG: DNA polymerase III subunit delta [Deltaproteobacteria bacterium]|nr:DNA polymerase III subunit delta [Deltaproteobacteria bacterium]